jgi:putative (di)nucleoside polyphosphate hydrolase
MTDSSELKPYRPCVVALFFDPKTKLLLTGQRSKHPGAWQFPQGGVESGESYEDALGREVREELGIADFSILKTSEHFYFYDFPKEEKIPLAQKFKGQKQKWFLCALNPAHPPNLNLASDQEFNAISWENPKKILDGIISWKKPVYYLALKEFGLIQ